MKWMETLPQCDFFLFFSLSSFLWNGNREDIKGHESRRGKAARPERRGQYTHGNGAAQKKKKKSKQTRNKLENIAASSKVVWEDCKSFFFFSSALRVEELFHVIAVTFYIYAQLFQSMANGWRSPPKGGVDLVLLSISTSPHPCLPSTLFPLY